MFNRQLTDEEVSAIYDKQRREWASETTMSSVRFVLTILWVFGCGAILGALLHTWLSK